jgi:DNA-binding MarR family transcriptional regulator
VEEHQRTLRIIGRGSEAMGQVYTDCMSNYTSARSLAREELAAWRGMLRVHAELTRALDAELTGAHGLPLSSYEVLLRLAGEPAGRMRMAELADAALLSRSGLSRLVDRLEKDGLVQRTRCDDDARGWFAEITSAGRRVLEEAQQTHLDGVRRLFLDRLAGDEPRWLGRLWARF